MASEPERSIAKPWQVGRSRYDCVKVFERRSLRAQLEWYREINSSQGFGLETFSFSNKKGVLYNE